ncbi:phasin family protein [Micromonospora carbonacea]|uniref:phasin family protein n=1 Tax=Micromonospora carbonacea TaxID=47853 RepID=UPI0033E93679
MQDAWRAYLGLAMGLTEAPRKKAQDVVRRVVGSGEATATQLQALAEELVSTGAANREALTKLVRFEVDRALGAVGLATADEVAELTRRVHELERQLREARAGLAEPAPPSPGPQEPAPQSPGADPSGATTSGAPAPVATKAMAKKAVATKAVAKKAVAKKAVARKAPAAVGNAEPAGDAAEPARPAKKTPARKRQPGGAA